MNSPHTGQARIRAERYSATSLLDYPRLALVVAGGLFPTAGQAQDFVAWPGLPEPFVITLEPGEGAHAFLTAHNELTPAASAASTATLYLGHVDKWRSHSLMQATSTKPRKLTAVLS